MKHIGIVACSAEGAALCYRTICLEGARKLGAYSHPQVSLHSHSLSDYVGALRRNDWQAVADLMLSSACKLVASGADFLICPDNTIHQAMPLVEPHSPRPWLHIAHVVARQAAARGFRNVALTGTQWLVESDVYPQALGALGIQYLSPDARERTHIGRIIMDELVNGIVSPASVGYVRQVIGRLGRAGCDAVVLGYRAPIDHR